MSSRSVLTSAWIARKCWRTRPSVSAFIGCAPGPHSTAFPAPGGPETLLAILFMGRAAIDWSSYCERSAGGFPALEWGSCRGLRFNSRARPDSASTSSGTNARPSKRPADGPRAKPVRSA